MRMQRETRSRTMPAVSEDVVFRHPSGAKPERIINVPQEGYSPYFEAYTPNSVGPRTEWKSFEHYRSDQAPISSLGKTQLACEAMGYYPDHSYGDASLPLVGYSHYSWGGGPGSPYGDGGRLDSDLPPLYVPREDGGFVPLPPDLDILVPRALASMLPYVKEELSVLNSIYELKDFKRPANKLVNTLKHPNLLKGLSKRLVRNFNPKSWSLARLVRSLAESNLQYQFAIRPLLADISAVCTALSRTEARINEFLARQGRPMNRHWVWSWQEFPNDESEVPCTGSWTWDSQFQRGTLLGASRQVISDASVFHAQVQYTFQYSDLQAAKAQLFAKLDALGVNLNPAIIWNAIPWTFLIDWVADVSQFLDSMKMQNMKPVLNIRRFLWSIKRKRRIYVTKVIKIQFYEHLISIQRTTLPVVVQSSYRRCADLPSRSSLEMSGLNLNQLSLGASLVITRRRHSRRRRH